MGNKLEIDGPAGRSEVTENYRDNYDRIFRKIPKCKNCDLDLSGFYDEHRDFYICVCGAKYRGVRSNAKT